MQVSLVFVCAFFVVGFVDVVRLVGLFGLLHQMIFVICQLSRSMSR